jgi:hypothetical protein
MKSAGRPFIQQTGGADMSSGRQEELVRPWRMPGSEWEQARRPKRQYGPRRQRGIGGATGGAISTVKQTNVQAGATVRAQSEQMVGTIESVDAQGAVISTGTARAKAPFSGLGRTSRGMVTYATRTDQRTRSSRRAVQAALSL